MRVSIRPSKVGITALSSSVTECGLWTAADGVIREITLGGGASGSRFSTNVRQLGNEVRPEL